MKDMIIRFFLMLKAKPEKAKRVIFFSYSGYKLKKFSYSCQKVSKYAGNDYHNRRNFKRFRDCYEIICPCKKCLNKIINFSIRGKQTFLTIKNFYF